MNVVKRIPLLTCLLCALMPVMVNGDSTLNPLFEALRAAPNEAAGREREAHIWEYWFDQAPNAEVRAALDAGIERREAYDYAAAEAHFDRVIEAAPDYAEGYNQRAFIRFLRDNIEASAQDLEKALALEPRHFGALAGHYHVLMRQGRTEVALRQLQQAVSLHPWIQERGALPQELWPEPYRSLREQKGI